MNTQNKYKINNGVQILSWVSGLSNFAMGIVFANVLSSLDSWGVSIAWLATMRVSGDVAGYLARIIAGAISDYSRKSLRSLLLFGYTIPLLFKMMFLMSSWTIFSIEVRFILFTVGNILDKMFNVWRDIPRDIAVIELTPKEHLQSTLALRKIFSSVGTASGALLAIFLKPLQAYGLVYIYIIAIIPSICGIILLYLNINMYDDIIIKNKEMKQNSKYLIYDNGFIFIITILTVIILFLGKLNEFYIFNAIKYIGYDTQILYVLFHFSSLILLGITYRNKYFHGITLLFSAIGLVVLCIVCIMIQINLFTIILLCLAYANYNSMLDTVLISTIMNRFNKAKYSAILLAIINISMGFGSILSIKFINFIQGLFCNELSFIASLIPMFLGSILILINYKTFISSSKIPIINVGDKENE